MCVLPLTFKSVWMEELHRELENVEAKQKNNEKQRDDEKDAEKKRTDEPKRT